MNTSPLAEYQYLSNGKKEDVLAQAEWICLMNVQGQEEGGETGGKSQEEPDLRVSSLQYRL